MSEEIDLRPYIELLARRWTWIVGGACIAILVALVASRLLPRVYQAEVMVSVVRLRTDVTFDERIRTILEDELSIRGDDARTRQEGLVALATGPDIARQVAAGIGLQLKPSERSISSLLSRVSARSRGNLIVITVQHGDPEVAALIANQWAHVYERHVNELYGTNRGGNVDAVAAQVTLAQATYVAAQGEVEVFIADNRIAILEHEISAQQALLDSYQSARNAIQTTPIDLQVNNNSQVLTNHYQDLQQVERWLTAARALKDQVAEDGGSTAADLGNVLALVFLHGQVFGGVGPVELQVDLDAGAVEKVRPADVDALIAVLEARREATQTQIDALAAEVATRELVELAVASDHPLNARIAELNAALLALDSELEAQTARQRELEQTRDTAWETYQVLREKQIEEAIAAQTPGTEVRLASSAVPPDTPIGTHVRNSVLIAGALGMMLSTFVVLAEGWWTGGTVQPQWRVATQANNSYTRGPMTRYSPGEEPKVTQ